MGHQSSRRASQSPVPGHGRLRSPANEAGPSRLSRVLSSTREVLLDLASLVWPVSCYGCGRDDRELCNTCREALIRQARALAVKPQHGASGTWFVAGEYEGLLRALLVQFKHHDRVGFARVLGRVLAVPLAVAVENGLRRASHAPLLLVPIPSRNSRVRERGYRHLEVLLRSAMRTMSLRKAANAMSAQPLPEVVRALVPTPARTGQIGLGVADRLMNARRMRVRRRLLARIAGRDVIVIDDVITTGATLAAADEVLRAAGVNVVGAVALCRVPKRSRSAKLRTEESSTVTTPEQVEDRHERE